MQQNGLPKKNRQKRFIEFLISVIHWVMFGVSAVFSIRLFSLLGSTPIDIVLYSTLAVAFEGAKITLWEVGNKIQRIIALAFVVVSLVASTAVAVAISEKTKNGGTDQEVLDNFKAEIAEYTDQIKEESENIQTLDGQIRACPPGYTTSIERLTKLKVESGIRRSDTVNLRSELEDELRYYRESKLQHTERTMFTMLADIFRISESMFTLVFMLVVSVLLEVGALTTTHRESVPEVPKEIRKGDIENCKCGSKQTSLERMTNGSYIVRCRTCQKNTSMFPSETQAREAWKGLQ